MSREKMKVPLDSAETNLSISVHEKHYNNLQKMAVFYRIHSMQKLTIFGPLKITKEVFLVS